METFLIPSETVIYGAGAFDVRGLSLPHIMAIIRSNRALMERLYGLAITGHLQANPEAIALELGDQFGTFAGLVIGHGARMPELAEQFGYELPFPVQIDALERIARLTLSNEGGLEKLMEIVVRTLGSIQTLQSPKT